MSKLKLLTASAVLALGLGILASAAPALADSAPATATTTFADNFVDVGDLVDITGTVLCAGDFAKGVCDGGGAVDVGEAAIQQFRDGPDPVACGTDGASFVTILALATPDGSGEVELVDFDTSTLDPNSITGFRTLYDDVGTSGSDHAPADFAGECADLVVLGPVELDIVKTLLDGPNDDAGAPIDLDTEFGLTDPDTADIMAANDNDDGVIGIGLGEPQHYVFELVSEDLPIGTVLFDVIPGEFDLDSADELAANGCTGDPELCDGVEFNDAVCVATPSRAPGASQGNLPKLEPEFLTVEIVAVGTCTIRVWVRTDGNPGHLDDDGGEPENDENNVWSLFEPTGCMAFRDDLGMLLADGNGDPIVDTIALNDGFKEFEAASGKRLLGPAGSLQLTPIGCDSDDDDVIDELDQCPVVGPEPDQVETTPGCWVDP